MGRSLWIELGKKFYVYVYTNKKYYGATPMTLSRMLSVFCVFACVSSLANAAPMPSSDQIKMFKSLPRAQQEALAKQYGIDLQDFLPDSSNLAPETKTDFNELFKKSPSLESVSKNAMLAVDAKSEQELKLDFVKCNELAELVNAGNQEKKFAGMAAKSSLHDQVRNEHADVEREQWFEECLSSSPSFFAKNNVAIANLLKGNADGLKRNERHSIRDSLKPFGYQLFSGIPTTYAPVADIPVPADYVIGVGDEIRIQLFGKVSKNINLTVTRKGEVNFPELGPISVVGLSYQQMTSKISHDISERMIGVQSSISLGELKSIQVFVLGDASAPGNYTLSSLSTLSHALQAAGGVSEIGSLRDIQLKRNGEVVSRLDVYDLLLKGDNRADVRLMSGDVIFVPPKKSVVGIGGEVARPAWYEIKGEETISDIVRLAAGFTSNAYPKASRLERVNIKGHRKIVDVDLSVNNSTKVLNGDVVEVYSQLDRVENQINLLGNVFRPGLYGYTDNLRLTDILSDTTVVRPNTDLEYIVVVKENPLNQEITTVVTSLAKALKDPQSENNLLLSPRDKILVFASNQPRTKLLEPVIAELKQQAKFLKPSRIVSIFGAVKYPDEYPFAEGMTVRDLLSASYSAIQSAQLDSAYLARFDRSSQKTSVFQLNLLDQNMLDFELQELDEVFVLDRDKDRQTLLNSLTERLVFQADKSIPANVVSISGDVKYPGMYPLTENQTLSDLIQVAGGFTASSYTLNAELSRWRSDAASQIAVDHFLVDLNKDVQTTLLNALDVVNVKRIPDWQERDSIELSGEVRFPGVYVMKKGETLQDVINRAGGFTELADLNAAVFTRKTLEAREQEQIDRIASDLKAELSSLAIDKNSSRKISQAEGEQLAERIQKTKAVGRLVIDLDNSIRGNATPILIEDGDKLFIPSRRQSISVMGEVQYSASHLYGKSLSIEDYIERSGGPKQRADLSRIYVIKANGSVYLPNKSSWFKFDRDELHPGDTIVVPLDTEYTDGLTLWSSATQILYNTAVAVAAIKSF